MTKGLDNRVNLSIQHEYIMIYDSFLCFEATFSAFTFTTDIRPSQFHQKIINIFKLRCYQFRNKTTIDSYLIDINGTCRKQSRTYITSHISSPGAWLRWSYLGTILIPRAG